MPDASKFKNLDDLSQTANAASNTGFDAADSFVRAVRDEKQSLREPKVIGEVARCHNILKGHACEAVNHFIHDRNDNASIFHC